MKGPIEVDLQLIKTKKIQPMAEKSVLIASLTGLSHGAAHKAREACAPKCFLKSPKDTVWLRVEDQ